MNQVSNVAACPQPVLKFPLTMKALRQAFGALQPEDVRIWKQPKEHEAAVDGSWPLSRLISHIRGLGFKPVGPRDSLAFVNDDATVGIVLQGAEPHPTKNTWKRYSLEVQARPMSVARAATAQSRHDQSVSYMTGL